MPNRLANETSPYLLQHADNPVDWHPWGAEALERAGSEDKPILLSIGYAACHWCHVMERESFSDPATARLMNQWFVPVKVDREERPDLDAVYMDAVQAMTGRGGWPMTVFLTPEGKPFFGGTYYPPEPRHGMPSFTTVLAKVREAWDTEREAVATQADKLTEAITRSVLPPHDPHELTEVTVRTALEGLRDRFEPEWGGFGGAPKFPQSMTLDFLLRLAARRQEDARTMAHHTMRRMALGGIRDHLGGGFHRYSTDERWHVPHFEKMLYDNALLLRLYTHGWLQASDPLYRTVASTTAEWMVGEMRHASGGFFSSQDADSEGVEGKFYVWSGEDFRTAAAEDADAAAAFFDVSPEGNWPSEQVNVLHNPAEPWAIASRAGTSVSELLAAVERARARLLDARGRRVRPETDDKVLASWNGLAASALVEAGRVLGRDEFVAAGVAAARFVLDELRDAKGRLQRAWRDGRTSGPAFLDDYAAMASACLSVYETTFNPRWFEDALRLADDAVRLFSDPAGGFFDTGTDMPSLVVRPKELTDNAVPSGNSLMCETLLRLAAHTGEASYEERALAQLRSIQPALASAPSFFGTWLSALDLTLGSAPEVAIAGDPESGEVRDLAAVVWRAFPPARALAVGSPESSPAALLRDRPLTQDRATAYVCRKFVCRAPVTTTGDLQRQLAV